MPNRTKPQPSANTSPVEPAPISAAEPGALSPAARSLAEFLQWLDVERHMALETLVGHRVRHSPTLLQIIRLGLIHFADGKPLTLAEAKRLLAGHGSGSSVRADVDLLEGAGLFVRQATGQGRSRRTLLLPSSKLVRWYNEDGAALVERMAGLINRRIAENLPDSRRNKSSKSPNREIADKVRANRASPSC